MVASRNGGLLVVQCLELSVARQQCDVRWLGSASVVVMVIAVIRVGSLAR